MSASCWNSPWGERAVTRHVPRRNEKRCAKKNLFTTLAGVAQLIRALPPKLKGRGFNSRAHAWVGGQVPSLGACKRQLMYLSHINVSLSLPPFSLSKINGHVPQ